MTEDLVKNALDALSECSTLVELYFKFREELAAGSADMGKYASLASGLKCAIPPSDLSARLKREGCRLGRPELVYLGMALGYAYGGFADRSAYALLAAAAAELGKLDSLKEVEERSGVDFQLMVKVICGVAKIVEEYSLDLLGGMYDVLEELRSKRQRLKRKN